MLNVTLNFESHVMNTGYRIVWVHSHNDFYAHSNSGNLGHNEIETNDCLVVETQCEGGACARDCQNEWGVPIVQ